MVPGLLLLILVLLGAGLLLGATVVFLMATALLRPPRMSDGKALWVLRRLSPGDLGMRFETLSFHVRDQHSGNKLRIAGWWIPHPDARGRSVLLLHGYADAKVGAIGWAPLWYGLGFNILAIDLRAHGESEGRHMAAGYWERHDVNQVINELRAQRPSDTRELVLFGASLGAVVAAATAAMREDVAALVLDSPFGSFADAAMSHMDRLGAPGKRFQKAALWVAAHRTAADFTETRVADLLSSVRCPVLAILPAHDPVMSHESRNAVQQILSSRRASTVSDAIWEPDCEHLMALPQHTEAYAARVEQFLRSNQLLD